jgi:hypothetical protein
MMDKTRLMDMLYLEDSSLVECYTVSIVNSYRRSENPNAFIFRPNHSKILKKNALRTFEISVTTHQSTQCNNPEDLNLQQHRCKNANPRTLYRNIPLPGSNTDLAEGTSRSSSNHEAFLQCHVLLTSSFCGRNVARLWKRNFTEHEAKYIQNFTLQSRVKGTEN